MRHFTAIILALPRSTKRVFVLALDIGLCIFTVWLAYYLRLGEIVPLSGSALWAAVVSMAIALPIFVLSGMYRAIFRYTGWPALITVIKASMLYGIFYASVFTVIGFDGVPRTVGLIQPILLVIFVGSSRALARFWFGGLYLRQFRLAQLPKALIYGAGVTGRKLAKSMANDSDMRIVGFLDDDVRLQGQTLNGLPIYSPDDLKSLTLSIGLSTVLLAVPSCSRARRNDIIQLLLSARVSVRTVPTLIDSSIPEILSFSDLLELDIDDLLGREQIEPNYDLFIKNICNKTVVVSGAGGSIGSELCRQILSVGPAYLLLIEQNEPSLHAIHQELIQRFPALENTIVPLLASVGDESRLTKIFQTWSPQTVYHAAAYKHVPVVEHNPTEGIKNNVLGTQTICKVSINTKVENFVLISTDKAVRPTNIMGATKRLAEMILQALATTEVSTIFSIVRFGNVLGSSGSVVPIFRQQIKAGGPVTLTHPEVTRYFMTIPEAAQLVIQSGAMAKGGDVFVLNMGPSVKIMDLAKRMIELSGRTVKDTSNPNGDISIEIVGLRPGEKLFEELLIGDNPNITNHPLIMTAQEGHIPWDTLQLNLDRFTELINQHNVDALQQLLQTLPLGYNPEGTISDWIYLHSVRQ
jgi:FlaA1/EpsC-like NDP-sugar epimerase